MIIFGKFVGFKILELFLLNSKTSFNLNEIAKKLFLSVSSVKYYCDLYLKEELLVVSNIGNQRRFSLNNNSVYTRELKKVVGLFWLREKGLEKLVSKGTSSMAVYGSFASGEFDDDSDLDLLFLGINDDIDRVQVSKFGKEIKREVQIVFYSWIKWEKMKKEKHVFAESILRKHILVKGVNL